jgi:hypothetical protein
MRQYLNGMSSSVGRVSNILFGLSAVQVVELTRLAVRVSTLFRGMQTKLDRCGSRFDCQTESGTSCQR